jgi:hypothetical protein
VRLSYEFSHAASVGAVHRFAIDRAQRGLADAIDWEYRGLDVGRIVLEFETRVAVSLVTAAFQAAFVGVILNLEIA